LQNVQSTSNVTAATSIFDNDEKVPKPSSQVRLASAGIINDFILESLAYKSMYHREGEITAAHSKTFEWVFRSQDHEKQENSEKASFDHQFANWLRSDELGPIYWITGKPGSGKSTFVRYLFQHEIVLAYLQSWAGKKPISMAGFFFWTSGSKEQRSQTGLLRSLLHQLLSVHPEYTQYAFPELWKDLRTMSTKDRIKLNVEWTAEKLMAGFHSFMDVVLPTHSFCFFIDGLDEFEGDHATIIDFFKKLAERDSGHGVKLCLSSRPWAVFEAAFQNTVPNLKLQDLTYGDMYQYAKDRLRANAQLKQQMKIEKIATENLLGRIVQQADGVFLWVRLAVNRMLEVATSNSVVTDLDAILNTLPTEIDGLFGKFVFGDQTAPQLAITRTLFQLIRARETVAETIRDESSHSLTVWELAFALDSTDDDLVRSEGVEEASELLVHGRCQRTRDAVVQRFAGLLDLFPPQQEGNQRRSRFDDPIALLAQPSRLANYRITYIHRTVRDWLIEGDGVYNRLIETSDGFDPHLRHLRSYVLRLKNSLEYPEQHRRLDEWWPDIALAMTHARHILQDPKQKQRYFLNELDNTLSWYWLGKSGDPYDHWARNAFGAYEIRMKAPPIWQPFLCLATKFGLTRYVLEEVKERNSRWRNNDVPESEQELVSDDATPLLSYATEFLCSTQKTIFPLSDPQLVSGLLKDIGPVNQGPNHEYLDFATRAKRTPWIALLRHLRDARRRDWIEYFDIDPQGTSRWATIVRLFIEGGADVKATVLADAWDPEITTVGVLKLLEQTYGSFEIVQLRRLLEEKQSD
jgi:hypothetical protein